MLGTLRSPRGSATLCACLNGVPRLTHFAVGHRAYCHPRGREPAVPSGFAVGFDLRVSANTECAHHVRVPALTLGLLDLIGSPKKSSRCCSVLGSIPSARSVSSCFAAASTACKTRLQRGQPPIGGGGRRCGRRAPPHCRRSRRARRSPARRPPAPPSACRSRTPWPHARRRAAGLLERCCDRGVCAVTRSAMGLRLSVALLG